MKTARFAHSCITGKVYFTLTPILDINHTRKKQKPSHCHPRIGQGDIPPRRSNGL